ncbi:MAG: hypothetical protein V1804_02200 [Patescibacteria group bacterium]
MIIRARILSKHRLQNAGKGIELNKRNKSVLRGGKMGNKKKKSIEDLEKIQCKKCGGFYDKSLEDEANKIREEQEKRGYTLPDVPACPVCKKRAGDVIAAFGDSIRETHPYAPSRRHR